MTTALLIAIAWKSALVSALALLLLKLLKGRSPAERSWLAHAGLAATLLVAIVTLWGPEWRVEAPAAVAEMLVADERPAAADSPISESARSASPAAPDVQVAWLDGERLALLAYAIPAALLLLVMLVAVIRLSVLRGRAEVLVEQGWLSALARAQRRMGFKHGTALLVTRELGSPVSWGVVRPIILLNEEAVGTREQAEAIIAHELAHVARLDWAKLIVGRIATALFWFNPLVWMLANQCHQLREEAADDAVLASDVPSTDYAQLLVGAARHECRGMLLAANGVAPVRGSLAQRVTRILDEGMRRAPPGAGWTLACALGAILVAAPLAALTPVAALVGGDGAQPETAASEASPAPTAETRPALGVRLEGEETVAADVAEAVEGAQAAVADAAEALSEVASAGAATPLHGSFDAIDLSGGGRVLLRHGAVRSVRVLRGGSAREIVSVSGGSLSIACRRGCTGDLLVEVVAPRVNAIAISGGGTIEARGPFPVQRSLALATRGGGTIDARALRGIEVAAATNGGGTIMTTARDQLAASTMGGGLIRYWGDPSVATSSQGGGSIERSGR
jgi:beta-lactamase regulating signal transducer with metallopeptidase domain